MYIWREQDGRQHYSLRRISWTENERTSKPEAAKLTQTTRELTRQNP
jgi:hypothetical protein